MKRTRPNSEEASIKSDSKKNVTSDSARAYQLAKVNPRVLLPQDVLQLQKTIGNKAVQRMLGGMAPGVKHNKPSPEHLAYLNAIKRHQENKKRLRDLFEYADKKATSNKELVKNSVEWYKQGKIKFYALTKTHDASTRGAYIKKQEEVKAKREGKQQEETGDVAYFGYPNSDLKSTSKDSYKKSYNNLSSAKDNVFLVREGVRGHNIGGKEICFVEPNQLTDDQIYAILIHEVQHTADRHHRRLGAIDNETEWNLERYKSEFRAYYLDGELSNLSMNRFVRPHDADEYEWKGGELQQKIFYHIYNNYEYVERAWSLESGLDHTYEMQPFRMGVLDFATLSTLNSSNSLHLDNVYDATEKIVYFDDLYEILSGSFQDGKGKDKKISSDRISSLISSVQKLDQKDLTDFSRSVIYHMLRINRPEVYEAIERIIQKRGQKLPKGNKQQINGKSKGNKQQINRK